VISRRTGYGILALATLAVLSGAIARKIPVSAIPGPVDQIDTRLNYAVYQFTGRLLNEDGSINVEIDSPLLRSNASSGVSTVISPEIRLRQAQERWKITAESAIITADREFVSLQGNVSLNRRNGATGERTDIRTRDVVLHLTPRTAETDAAVSIRQAGSRLEAVGMRLDLTQETYELLEKVTAHYELP
jgi:LPS export ABC transporter protein LptC